MKKFRLLIPGIFIISIFLINLEADNSWTLVKNKNGIRVFTRPIQGMDIDEFMGITVINARIDVVSAVLTDVPSQTLWMHNCKVSRIIKVINENHNIIYNVTSAPWPISDRDVVIKSIVKRDYKNGRIFINVKAIKSDYPGQPGHVRITKLTGNYTLKIIGLNKTEVVYQVKADPAGAIPAWLANRSSRDLPFITLTGLIKMTKKQKYRDLARDREEIEKYLSSIKK